MKKLTLFSLLLFCSCLGMVAQNTLRVVLKSGSVVSYTFSEKPALTFHDVTLVVSTETNSVEYPFADVEKMDFMADINEGALGLQSLAKAEISLTPGTVTLSGVKPQSKVVVYDLNGKAVQTHSADASGNLVFSTASLPKGAYVVKTDKVSYKIINK